MHYLFLGEDENLKDAKISALRKEILPSNDAQKFDCDILYANKLSAEDLKKSLISIPAVAPQRLIVIRLGEKLNKQHKELLVEFFELGSQQAIILLEAAWKANDPFVKKVAKFFQVEDCSLAEGESIFAVTRLMTQHRHAEAMTSLHQVLEGGQHPLQIMGGLVWFWGNKARGKVSKERFEKGLLCLQEADLNIKRSKLAPNYALEILIAKLCVLLDS